VTKKPAASSAAPKGLKRESAYETLLLDILCGVLRPGEAVDELSVSANYQLPRAGVREALARLAHEGLVSRRPRLGSVVADLGVIELQQIFDLRVQLEARAAALAASNATAADVARIRAAYADAETALATRDFREVIRMDLAFHQALGEATHNRWLALVTNTLNCNALRFWHYSLSRRPIDTLRREIAAHQRIADAIAAGDALEAQAAMRDVLGEFPSTVKGVFEDALFAQVPEQASTKAPRKKSSKEKVSR
jgi:DNA-binding GntR family transcriptional regulator